MKQVFNHQGGVTPEQTRLALSGNQQDKSMIEQEQPHPVLKPRFMGQEVDNQLYKQRLKQEHNRVMRYQIKVTEMHTILRMNGQIVSTKVDRQVQHVNRAAQLSNDFNINSAQAHDQKQLSLSY
ncbi:hypothetical protein EYS14_00085 [Alteromonadaceae bacterium M269]|nr:hypothetical protein EYS14_00085 [Alteromonadaceae bacterium M269]